MENEATIELREEIETRCRLHPTMTRRIGNFGFIELEDTWGDEATIVNTARISTTNKRVQSVAEFGERDRQLLCLLLKENHGTPFETVYFRFRFIAPIFVLRQWVKHRISTWNEFSQRYRQPITTYYIPDEDARSVNGFPLLTDSELTSYTDLLDACNAFYQDTYKSVCERIGAAQEAWELPPWDGGRNPYRGRARELLRNVMPVATYSDVYWTVNFRSLMNFFNLRRKPGAQYEIRQYADAAYEMFCEKFPVLADCLESVDEKNV